jgi:predicted PurR-regulated permease PerM
MNEQTSLPPAAHINPPATPGYQVLTGVVVGVVVVAALYFARDVLLPIAVAVLLSFVLSPLVSGLRRFRIPRAVAVLFSVAFALGIIAGVGTLVGTQLVQVAGDLPQYQTTIGRKIDTIQRATIGRLLAVANRLEGAIFQTSQNRGEPSAAIQETPAPEQAPVPVQVRQPPPDALSLAKQILAPVLHPLATAAIIFIVAVFILMQRDDLRDRLIRLFGSHELHRATLAMDDAAHRLSRYFLVQLGLNATFGVIIGVALYFIGLPNPLLWGTTAGLMRFVPYIGSYIGAGVPILLASAVDPGWSLALWVAALFLVTEPILGQVVEPMLYGRSTGLSPISVVISVIFWTWLWGPVGLILSTPLTLCLVVLGQHVKQLEFLDVMFGDRPALSSVENFYQRVLAGDLDEVQEHAEELLNEMSLAEYYDNVAMKGLELAAHDLARGVLASEQTARIKEVVITLLHELDAYDDVRPLVTGKSPDQPSKELSSLNAAPLHECTDAQQNLSIHCIANRGPLDDAPAMMLVQLLGKHKLDARLVRAEVVSRKTIETFDDTGICTICVCSIEARHATSSLRFLLRRLRQRMSRASILVVLWPTDHPAVTDLDKQAVLAADYYASSLQDAVQFCLKSANSTSIAQAPKQNVGAI